MLWIVRQCYHSDCRDCELNLVRRWLFLATQLCRHSHMVRAMHQNNRFFCTNMMIWFQLIVVYCVFVALRSDDFCFTSDYSAPQRLNLTFLLSHNSRMFFLIYLFFVAFVSTCAAAQLLGMSMQKIYSFFLSFWCVVLVACLPTSALRFFFFSLFFSVSLCVYFVCVPYQRA